MLVDLATDEEPSNRAVGGKAASLTLLKQAGFRVPDGVVLTTGFFAPWLLDICSSAEWKQAVDLFADAHEPIHGEVAAVCAVVKDLSDTLTLNPKQAAVLDLASRTPGPLAVRSSSPEEDLAGASFAGLYETVLGVDAADLEAAVRVCFKSCLDARVIMYKRQMHIEDLSPSIAVVVQSLVPSETAGVAFSINPATNDFDEVLINASKGLGEALVAGDITPDSAVVDKLTGNAIEKQLGNAGDAGSKAGDSADEICLTDAQICEISDTVAAIENHYGLPMDIEWAYAKGELYIVQARPITTHIPLHPSLVTEPGAPRRLYMDGYLTDGVTMSVGITPMANDVFKTLLASLWAWINGKALAWRHTVDFSKGGLHVDTGRLYIDLSMWLHLMGKSWIAKKADGMNPMMASILMSDELDAYRLAKPPKIARAVSLLKHVPRLLWHGRRAVWVLLWHMTRTARFDANYARELAEFDQWIRRPVDFAQSVEATLVEDMSAAGTVTMNTSYPAYIRLYFMMERIKKLVDQDSPEQLALADAVCGGYEKDMIVNMGLKLYDMSKLIPEDRWDDLAALEKDLTQRRLPAEFYTLYEHFIYEYGCRGPLEMEIANEKYGDSPMLVLQQLKSLATAGGSYDPHQMRARRIRQREDAYGELMQLLPPKKAKKLARAYQDCVRYSDAREYFKHHVMQCYSRVRELLLYRADALVDAGRLDCREQLFDLTLADVDRAATDPSFDVRAAVAERGAFTHKLKTHVRHFPMCIDSRGRVLRSKTRVEDGALVGAPVSPGTARGPVKVLSNPFEKELEPGDVLVAVTTDPGWTPLFINVSAVILEIGGQLQHGALVAREYGKPCVSAIPDVVNRFADGQMVEVDGSAGLVRFV